jgi:streptogrisin C
MMLTAGHCIYLGGPVSTTAESMGSVTANSRENWSSTVGTQYLTGQTTYRGDMALIQLSGSKTSAGRIYRGNSESVSSGAVTGMFSRAAASNDGFCTGGSSRKADGSAGPGEICGWVVNVASVDYQYATGHWWRNVVRSKTRTGWCNRPGDSGSPVYIVVSGGNVTAKGILVGAGGGGSDYYAGALDGDPCSVTFTDIYQAYFGFPGVITVG